MAGADEKAAKAAIIKMLKADHDEVKQAFKEFEKLDKDNDAAACEQIVRKVVASLEVHAAIEEEIFYPEARQALDEEDLVDEAEVEHMTVKVLLDQLNDMDSDDDKFAATFHVLGEYVQHHIKEEEGEMFKQLDNGDADWPACLEQMQSRRAELQEEKGLPQEDASRSAGAPARSTARRSSSASAGESRPQASSGRRGGSSKR